MKKIEKKNYYEILEISSLANPKEIEGAYEKAKQTFRADSLALYSLMDVDEIEHIMSYIEKAYKTLIVTKRRRDYDQELLKKGELSASDIFDYPAEQSLPIQEKTTSVPAFQKESPEPEKAELSQPASYDGKGLRDFRISKGIELVSIAETTKISTRQLGFIEDNNTAQLPALIYLKGFIREYAKCLGLDSEEVLANYLRLNDIVKD